MERGDGVNVGNELSDELKRSIDESKAEGVEPDDPSALIDGGEA